jgi:hypothetical protein
LVSTLLFTVLIGMLQYGLYFNDALGTRNGVREAVRQGVVQNFDGKSETGSTCSGDEMAKLKCVTKGLVDPLSGTIYVKIVKPATWKRGNPLVVCAMVKSNGAVGLLPLPNGGWISSKTQMSIEDDDPVIASTPTADVLPGSVTWTWCS